MKALEERVEGELIENRRGAIRLAVTLGRQLQTDMPIIADKYRNGMFAREIVEEHGITKRYNASSSVAIAAVRYAISGYKGDSSCPAYEGLIKNAIELERLALEHHERCGKETLKQGKGVYSLTKEEKVAIGEKQYKDKKGIHAQTREERRELSKKGVIALGFISWTEGDNWLIPSEIGYTYWLTQQPENIRKEQPMKGRPDLDIVKRRVNDTYHEGRPVRTKRTLLLALNRHKRKLKQISQ